MKKCEDTYIGNPAKNLKGISGGERRRLAFGCELLTNPNLLFCDEPTSGLDSFMAMALVESMREQANSGKVNFYITMNRICFTKILALLLDRLF